MSTKITLAYGEHYHVYSECFEENEGVSLLWGGTLWCGCKTLDMGPIYITWFNKDCKCGDCGKHSCECKYN